MGDANGELTMFSNRIRANTGHGSHTDAHNNFYLNLQGSLKANI